ncbi:PAS domain S-box protein [Geothrix sp. 21YS21S-2]|uniref:PAS domain S-box protein n=1 Tax=Geothrix sp. 21YS21S-2 TaxID=3068893 RepID=UPI0027B8B7DC|nr:PAS domain S-box protein [Geothrix sp. 21YS21S-2]
MPETPLEAPQPRTLLIIEDDPLFSGTLADLAAAGLPGTAASSAATLGEGLRRLRGGGIDLVVLGAGLGGGPGLPALDMIWRDGGDLAIVLVAKDGADTMARLAIRRGAEDFLAPPDLSPGRLAHCLLSAFERNARKRESEQRLRENEEMFRVISENAGDLVALLDQSGRRLFQNFAHARTLGFTMEELNEFPPMFLFHPEDRDRLQAELAELFQGGREDTTEFRLLHKDGTWRHFEGRAAIVRGRTASGDLAIIVSRDITARVKADTELLKAHAIKNLILENSTLGIAFVRDRVFEWVNSRLAEILGRPLAQLLGAPTRILYPDGASYDEMARSTYDAMRRGERADVTWQLLRGDGSSFWCRMIGRPLNPAIPHEGSVWLMEDTTENRKIEQARLSLEVQLRHAQKLEAIGQLAAGIAHEINTPTQYIGDNTKFLAEAFQDLLRVVEGLEEALPEPAGPLARILEEVDLPYLKEEIPRAIEQSAEGIARVTRIVKAMKDFSHPGSEEPVDVDLNRSIESTITVSRNEWKYVANLVLELDPNLPPVLCYPNEINQAVLNLVVNAAHAISDAQSADPETKGTITVSTALDAGMAEIRVRDTGTGIPEHVRPRIFDPFFTTKEVGRGTGQGLAIVHTVIVERHKGTVAFETETGSGSVFILRVPVTRDREGGRLG